MYNIEVYGLHLKAYKERDGAEQTTMLLGSI